MIILGDALEKLKTLKDKSVQCCVTSPPYWGLRNYGVAGQLGLEKTPEEYVEKLVVIFREVHRVLKDDGTLWLNLGDTYAQTKYGDKRTDFSKSPKQATNTGSVNFSANLSAKNLIGIPWRVAFALQKDGWILRQDIIWHKPNPMPESVTDRCTRSHEYIFMLTKEKKYFYNADAVKEESIFGELSAAEKIKSPYKQNLHKMNLSEKKDKQRGHSRRHAGFNDRWDKMTKEEQCTGLKNKRSVWTVSTKPYSQAHFATFPHDLIEPCVLAVSKESDTILDPFFGSGTTGLVAKRFGRKYIGIELNPEYIKMAFKRVETQLTIFDALENHEQV